MSAPKDIDDYLAVCAGRRARHTREAPQDIRAAASARRPVLHPLTAGHPLTARPPLTPPRPSP